MENISFFRKLNEILKKEYIIVDNQRKILRISHKISKQFFGRKKVKGLLLTEVCNISLSTKLNKATFLLQSGNSISADVFHFSDASLLVFGLSDMSAELQRLNFIFQGIKSGIMACDENGKIILYNSAYALLDGLNAKNVIGHQIDEIYITDERGSVLIDVMKTREAKCAHRQQYKTYLGNEVDVVKDCYPIISGDKVMGAYALVREWEYAKAWAKQVINETVQRKFVNDVNQVWNIGELALKSHEMKRCLQHAKMVAKENENIFITGANGTECDMIAEYIVTNGNRSEKAFVTVDLAAIPSDLMGKFLFGYSETDNGQAKYQSGILETLDGGTLMIKNIDVMLPIIQSMFQNFLVTHTFYPIDSIKARKSNVRFIIITARTPTLLIEEKNIRADLVYRLSSIYLFVPELKNRPEDIMVYVRQILVQINKKLGRNVNRISPLAEGALKRYSWPGNFLELSSVIESASAVCSDNPEIGLNHLPDYIIEANHNTLSQSEQTRNLVDNSSTLSDGLENMERLMIQAALERNCGNISRAAADLGIKRQNLQYRIKKLQLS